MSDDQNLSADLSRIAESLVVKLYFGLPGRVGDDGQYNFVWNELRQLFNGR